MAKKSQKGISLKNNESGEKKRNVISILNHLAIRVEPWLPWVLASAYFIFMTYLTFRYHRIGGFGVETDFYAELVPQAKKLLNGQFSPLNYGLKGPVYSMFLAGVYIVVREYFYAGLIINLISSFVFIYAIYYLVKIVFNRITSVFVTVAIIFNYSFQNYTYQAGSDMPFLALCALSMLFLFRSREIRNVVLSALFGLLAFLVRYNGVFIAMGAVIYLSLIGGSLIDRLKRIGIWITIFIVAGLPWFIPNYITTGNPVHNDNYINVMMEYYALGKEDVSYENWEKALPENFTGLGDIFMYNPTYFIKHTGLNVLRHFLADIKILIKLRLGILVVLGLLTIFFLKPDKQKLIYFSFGVIYFLILTLVFYNERFSLYLLTMYIPLAVWPFTEKTLLARLKNFFWVPFAIIFLIIASYSYTSTKNVLYEIKNPPTILEELKELGINLEKIEHDKSQKIMARKPNVAYYAGLNVVMFPEDVRSVEELIYLCRDNSIRYILYSGVEYSSRPHLKILFNTDFNHNELEKVESNNAGVIFRVTGI